LIECDTGSRPSIYNCCEFPTAVVPQVYPVCGGEGSRVDEDAHAIFPRVPLETPAPPAFVKEALERKRLSGFVSPAVFFPKSH